MKYLGFSFFIILHISFTNPVPNPALDPVPNPVPKPTLVPALRAISNPSIEAFIKS